MDVRAGLPPFISARKVTKDPLGVNRKVVFFSALKPLENVLQMRSADLFSCVGPRPNHKATEATAGGC